MQSTHKQGHHAWVDRMDSKHATYATDHQLCREAVLCFVNTVHDIMQLTGPP